MPILPRAGGWERTVASPGSLCRGHAAPSPANKPPRSARPLPRRPGAPVRASSSACGHPPQGLRERPGPMAPSRAPRVPRGPSPLPSSLLPAPTCPAGPSSNASPLAASAFPLSSWNLPRGRHSSRLLPLAGNARTGSGVRTSLCQGTRAWRRQEPLRGWRTRRRGWVTSHGERTLAPSLPPAPGLRATTGPPRQLDSPLPCRLTGRHPPRPPPPAPGDAQCALHSRAGRPDCPLVLLARPRALTAQSALESASTPAGKRQAERGAGDGRARGRARPALWRVWTVPHVPRGRPGLAPASQRR